MENRQISSSWKHIWERKGQVPANNLALANLIAIDGFDTGTGKFPLNSWLSFTKEIRENLNLGHNNKLLEVGCGAGAFLLPMYQAGIKIYGIDYSDSLLKLSSKLMPNGIFKLSEACTIPFENNFFNAVISNSVFQYFSDLEYAENVIIEIYRVLKAYGKAAILDINDAAMKNEYESIRRKKIGAEAYDKLYGHLTHQFYGKKWFEDISKLIGLKCKICEQNIKGYENSIFRYNVFLKKK